MTQVEKVNRLLMILLGIVVILSSAVVYRLYIKQHDLAVVVAQVNPANVCDNTPKVERVLETVVHKTSPWGALQPQIKDAIVQIFSQVAEFNWLQPYQTPSQKMATGTGFFIDSLGHIITNAHVVNQAKAVTIQIPSLGKEQFETDVVSICFDRDIALLKLKTEDYDQVVKALGRINFLPIGDSDELYRADQIMYQGFPLGQQGLKSTVGVVSGRENVGGRQYIQIDAAVNPGCSGGPALNLNGETVGVITATILGAQNVGYMIPAKELKVVLNDLYHSQDPLVRRPYLGISYNSASSEMNKFLGNPLDGGIYVVAAFKDSVLDNVGVKAGDMIYEINGHKIDYYGEISVPWAEDKISLTEYISYLSIAQPIEIIAYRNGSKHEFKFKFEQSKLAPVRFMYPDFEKIDYEIIGGFVIMELTLNHVAIMQQVVDDLVTFKNPKHQAQSKLLITHIFPSSLAQRARVFDAGNILKSVNEEPVANLNDLRHAIKKSLKTGNLTIRTKQDVFAVLPFNKLLQQEPQLALIYRYQMTDLMQELVKQVQVAPVAPVVNATESPVVQEEIVV